MMIPRNHTISPFFTIITPSFNQGRYIRRTIESVLSQGVEDVEYLIFDGGSSDETVSILESFGDSVQWISEPDRGQAHAVNKGLSAAKGEVIGWLNSDDIYYPNALPTVRTFLERHPEVEVLYGEANHIDENDEILERYYTEGWNYERLKDICYICQPSVFLRRRVVQEYGLLDVNLRYCMDYEYWLRLGRDIHFMHLSQTLAGSRMYRDNKTLKHRSAVHAEINHMLKKRLGKTPTRWIYNYAFAVVDSKNYHRAEPKKYVWTLVWSLFVAYLRWRHKIPRSAVKAAINWLYQSFRVGSELGIPEFIERGA